MITFISDKTKKLSKTALEENEDLSYSAFMKLLRKKDIKVNGKRVSEDIMLNPNDKVEIFYTAIKKQKYTVIFEDDNILVIDKKSGYTSESVFDDIKKAYENAFFIHRLDRNTSGLMIFALSENANKELLFGFKNRTFIKKYLATCVGKPNFKNKVLTAYLVKDSIKSEVKIFDRKVKDSVEIKTGVELVSYSNGESVLSVNLLTGKTHQIRAHLAHIGLPIVGDEKYGDNEYNKKKGIKTQQLKAYYLQLNFEKDSPLSYLSGKSFKV